MKASQEMIIAIDVDYRETHAVAAALCFEHWNDPSPIAELTETILTVEDYVPGQFYKRELPCIQALLAKQPYDLTTIIVDGYVYLGAEQKPGLGKYLWDTLDSSVPVIGVAKKPFHNTLAYTQVFRGQSKKPLFVTAVGVEQSIAKQQILSMHGPYRIPTLLKRVDALCRS